MTELWKNISILGESWHFYIHFRPLSAIFQEKVVTLRQKQEYMQNSIIGRKEEIALLKKNESHWQPRRTARPRDSWNSIETLYAKWDWRVFSVFWFPLVTSECVAYLHGSRWRTLLSQSVQSRWKSGTRNRRLFFSENGELQKEYRRLFASLFRNPEPYLAVIKLLAAKPSGIWVTCWQTWYIVIFYGSIR